MARRRGPDVVDRVGNSAAPPVPAQPAPGGSLPGPRLRRQPKFLVLALVLVLLGALGAVWLVSALGDRASVVAIAAEVTYGDPIAREDLVEAQVSADPALQPIPWSDVESIVGMFAATDLLPGSLLTRDQVTGDQLPPAGMQLVGVGVPMAQLPATPLLARDEVLLIPVAPIEGEASPGQQSPIEATVVRVGPVDVAGARVVDVLVDDSDGATVAELSAGGLLSIVLVRRG